MEPMKPMKPMAPMKPMEPMKPMKPMKPMSFGAPWWPDDLGQPSSSGAQNDMRYAFFPDKRRLLIEDGGTLTTYDSGDHRINGVSQQGGNGRSLAFTSQDGTVRLDDLTVVDAPSKQPSSRPREGSGRPEGGAGGARDGDGDPEPGSSHGRERREPIQGSLSQGSRPSGERVVFTEEADGGRHLKLIAGGDIDADMLEALEDFIKRQKRRLARRTGEGP